jgi:hypothetical protein
MPQFWIGSGKSGNPSDGVFETTFNVGWPILAVASVRVCEGKPFQEHNGDAVFELQAIDWSTNGDFKLTIGQWNRKDFYGSGNRNRYTRSLSYAVTVAYVADVASKTTQKKSP